MIVTKGSVPYKNILGDQGSPGGMELNAVLVDEY